MIKPLKVFIRPHLQEITAFSGDNLLKLLRQLNVSPETACGGKGTCGKCKVKIISGKFELDSYSAIKHLSKKELKAGIVLACQTKLFSDLVVELEKNMNHNNFKTIPNELSISCKPNPSVKKVCLKLMPPSREDLSPDLERLLKMLPENLKIPNPIILSNLPEIIHKDDFTATVIISDNHLLGIEAGDTTRNLFGVAFDIGTTTLMGALVDLNTGKTLKVLAMDNPQMSYGLDVISRVNYTLKNKDGILNLKHSLITALNQIIDDLACDQNIKKEQIYEITVVGNTIMTHLFLGFNPTFLAKSPFIPVFGEMLKFTAKDLGLYINSQGLVTTLPNIAAFAGSDILGALVATGADKVKKGFVLLIDLGTNSEIALISKDKILVCSAAAGPAFEGAHIKSGMRALAGAITDIYLKDGLPVKVIGEVKPRGICGSGLVNIVAKLLDSGLITKKGRFADSSVWRKFPELRKYFHQSTNHDYLTISPGVQNSCEGDIILTQKDIRELQMAKGAIYTGIIILLREMGISFSDLNKILLAGAFGNYVDPVMAIKIGLLPPVMPGKVFSVGNAAGSGAILALISKKARSRFTALKNRVQYIELSRCLDFKKEFIKSLDFL